MCLWIEDVRAAWLLTRKCVRGAKRTQGRDLLKVPGIKSSQRYIMRAVAEDWMLLMGTIYCLLVAVTNIKFCGPFSVYSFFVGLCSTDSTAIIGTATVCRESLSV